MNTKALKDKILQLAIRGKLVEQNPKDEPASMLLERIKEEKEKLLKEKKIKKQKPLPEITEDEKPFEIPNSWEWVRLGEVLDIKRGASPRPIKKYLTNDTNGVYWIKIGDATRGGKYIISVNEKITLEGAKKSVYLQSGALIMSNSMSFGKAYILGLNGCIHDGWLSFEYYKEEDFSSELLQYFLSASYEMFDKVAVGTGVRNLNINRVRATLMPLPPLSEQKRIVEKVDELFALIDVLEEGKEVLLKAIKLTRNKVLQEAIQGKLVEQDPKDEPARVLLKRIKAEREKLVKEKKIKKQKLLPEITEDEKPFEIPNSWEWVRLGEICKLITDGTHKTPKYVNKGTPFLSVKNISNGYLDKSDIKYITREEHEEISKRGRPEFGDILFCRIGTLGKAFLLKEEYEFSIFVSLGLLKFIDNSIGNYIELMMNSPEFYRQIEEVKVGGSHTNKINLRDVPNFRIPLPPLSEQKRIVEKVDEIMSLCDELEKQIQDDGE